MEYQQLIESRYSVRKYTDEPLTTEEINAILEAGRIAPTSRNSQPHRIWVVTKSEDLAIIDKYCPRRFGAPAVLVCGFSKEATAMHSDVKNGDWCYGFVDGSVVLTHMMLKAHDMGLGACWVSFFDGPMIQEAFNLPDDVTIYSLMPFGHVAPDSTPSSKHFERLPLEETVVWLK